MYTLGGRGGGGGDDFRRFHHLLLVLPLRVEASLDALPGLLEGLPLGALGGVMGAHAHDVGAGEDQHVGHDLWRTGETALGRWTGGQSPFSVGECNNQLFLTLMWIFTFFTQTRTPPTV